MPEILIKNKLTKSSNILIITTKFSGDPLFPVEVNDYLQSELKGSKKTTLKEAKKTISYNYFGRIFSLFIVEDITRRNANKELIRKHGATISDMLSAIKASEVYIFNQTTDEALSLAAAEGITLAGYRFLRHKSGDKEKNTLAKVIIANTSLDKKSVEELNTLCEATALARDLVNEPVNKLNAVGLSDAFVRMGKTAGFKVTVYNKTQIEGLKMGGLLAVNAGSVDEPTFTVMEYKSGKAKNKKPYVLVGKGVVYDTGGLSLKPTPNSMDLMKCDMAGAAAVAGALFAIAKSRLPVHVIGLVPATDNRPGFNAFAPGDIITMMDGSNVEMLNSDAEGRMILADALHYAKRYKPQLTIDIATLTGAAMAAIGSAGIVGMGTADAKEKERLLQSGLNVHERIAEFPFWDEYDELLKSDIADCKNIGGPVAGAITAGKFLVKFTDYPYYHLDIAGPAFLTAKDSYRGKGGTGVGVRLFFDFFKSMTN